MLFVLSLCARAAPVVNSVSGTLSDGEPITIGGNAFGSKLSSAPGWWDTFENDTLGESLSNLGYAQYGALTPHTIRNNHSHGGSQSAGLDKSGENFTESVVDNLDYDEIYVSFWFRWDLLSGTAPLTKMLRVMSPGNYYNGWPGLWYTTNPMASWHYTDVDNSANGSVQYVDQQTFSRRPASGVWERFELHFKHSTGGNNNGFFHYWYTGDSVAASGLIKTRPSDDVAKIRSVLLPMATDPGTFSLTVNVDDLYIDNTPARVEICAGSTWSNRGACEVQPATSWTTSAIEFSMNQGAMPDDSTRYLYVVDGEDAANSSGYQVTISSGSGDSNPKYLRMLSAQ